MASWAERESDPGSNHNPRALAAALGSSGPRAGGRAAATEIIDGEEEVRVRCLQYKVVLVVPELLDLVDEAGGQAREDILVVDARVHLAPPGNLVVSRGQSRSVELSRGE